MPPLEFFPQGKTKPLFDFLQQMKEPPPHFHPANKAVLMYQIPADTGIASGIRAPQDFFGGGGIQIFFTTG